MNTYIIPLVKDKIKDTQKENRLPLYVEPPPERTHENVDKPEEKRGSIEIDFNIKNTID